MPIDEREQDNRVLRTLIITALTETGRSRDAVYEKIGEFYYFNAHSLMVIRIMRPHQ